MEPSSAAMVLADPDDIPEFNVAPWMIGLTQEDSIKGKSKLVHTMDVVQGFLKQPYNSKTEPLQMVFASGSTVGSPIEDWSMRVCIGMSKASAARMILEAVSALDLPREELQAIAPVEGAPPDAVHVRPRFNRGGAVQACDGHQEHGHGTPTSGPPHVGVPVD